MNHMDKLDTSENRSVEVIAAYKRDKLAHSVLRQAHRIIEEFEREHVADWRMARYGLAIVGVLVACALLSFSGVLPFGLL